MIEAKMYQCTPGRISGCCIKKTSNYEQFREFIITILRTNYKQYIVNEDVIKAKDLFSNRFFGMHEREYCTY